MNAGIGSRQGMTRATSTALCADLPLALTPPHHSFVTIHFVLFTKPRLGSKLRISMHMAPTNRCSRCGGTPFFRGSSSKYSSLIAALSHRAILRLLNPDWGSTRACKHVHACMYVWWKSVRFTMHPVKDPTQLYGDICKYTNI